MGGGPSESVIFVPFARQYDIMNKRAIFQIGEVSLDGQVCFRLKTRFLLS